MANICFILDGWFQRRRHAKPHMTRMGISSYYIDLYIICFMRETPAEPSKKAHCNINTTAVA